MYAFNVTYSDGRRETITGNDFNKLNRKQGEFVKKAMRRNSDIYEVGAVAIA